MGGEGGGRPSSATEKNFHPNLDKISSLIQIPDSEGKKALDPGSGPATLNNFTKKTCKGCACKGKPSAPLG
jgi:hypothetical protein